LRKPDRFEQDRNEAKKNKDGKKPKSILNSIEIGRTYLTLANEKAEPTRRAFDSVLVLRSLAIEAKFKGLAETMEEGGTDKGVEQIPALAQSY
jgi:hypothetical protein